MLRILIWLVVLGCGADDPVHALEDRLYAPCCKRQSLRDHESPLANRLRGEIRSRIDRGESSEAIEQDLIRRYGDEIQVVPASMTVGIAGLLAGLVGAIVLVQFVRRRRGTILPSAINDPDSELEDEEESYATFADCYIDHSVEESLPPDESIAICCLDHPIAGEANVVCGESATECTDFVDAEVSETDDPALTLEDIEAGCDIYIQEH